MSTVARKPVESAAPTWEPVTLAEAKRQCKIAASTTYHDAALWDIIQGVRDRVERETSLSLVSRTWTETLDDWPGSGIHLQRRPVTAVDSIKYQDTADSEQTLDSGNYVLDTYATRPTIWWDADATLPSLSDERSAVTVTYTAGYASRATVPPLLKQAILLIVCEAFGDSIGQPPAKRRGDELLSRYVRAGYP